MKKKLSDADRAQAYRNAAMYEVMDLLGWDETRYNNYKYECGLNYLWAHLHGDADGFAQLTGSSIYWDWWKLHWYIRESEWLMFCRRAYCHPATPSPLGTQFGRRAIYLVMNNPYELAEGKTINGRRMADSYARLWCRQ